MSAQEMTLPSGISSLVLVKFTNSLQFPLSDVVIPTSSADKENIVLKAGQRVMVLKSHKGIYMQLESGKIIAIRTSSAVAAKKVENQASTSSASTSSALADSIGGGESSSEKSAAGKLSDDDDIIMTSITYPHQQKSTTNSAPDHQAASAAATNTAAAVVSNSQQPVPAHHHPIIPSTAAGAGNYHQLNGGRRRGRPPTYNGYHPSYIPPGVVPQPLQPYSHASAKNFASTNYGKTKSHTKGQSAIRLSPALLNLLDPKAPI